MTDSGPQHCFDLEFAVDRAGRTFLGEQFVKYPVHICRGLHVNEQAPEACAVTLQSVSGGLFESDCVAGRLRAQAGAQVHVNTSASTIVHAMRQAGAEQAVELHAQQDAFLQYLPEPLILFPGSRLCSTTTVHAVPGATTLFCESFLAHDPKSQGQAFASLDTRIDVLDESGQLLARDRMVLSGEQWQARNAGVSSHYPVYGSVWLIQPGEDHTAALALIRAVLDDATAYAGASRLPHQAGLQVRILSVDAVSLRRALHRVCAQVRCHQRQNAGIPIA